MKSQKIIFFLSIILAIITFWNFSLIKNIKLLIVLFHEIFHASAVLLTGGVVKKILIHNMESGETIIQGNRFAFLFIVSAGYIGSSIMGGFLLYKGFEKKYAKTILFFIGIILILFSFNYSIKNILAHTIGIQSGILFILCSILSREISSLVLIFLGTSFALYSLYDLSDFTYQLMNSDAGILSRWLIGNNDKFLSLNKYELAVTIALIWTFISVSFIFVLIKKTFTEPDPFGNYTPIQRQFAESNVSPEVAKWFLERGLDLNGKPLSKNWAVDIKREGKNV